MGYSIGRSGSDSRCCQPTDYPLEWVDYTDSNHAGLLEIETWLNTLNAHARDHEIGRVEELMEAASLGRLEDSGDERTPIKPIRRNPEIFEIRHKALSKPLRFYHGEPGELPDSLVQLHRHIKSGTSQESHVLHAVQRYLAGRPSQWGTL